MSGGRRWCVRIAGLAIALGFGGVATGSGQATGAGSPDRLSSPSGATQEVRVDSVAPVGPLGALVRSLVLPGWGQVAVGRPERGAVYFGAEAASLFMVFKSHAKLAAARRADPVRQGLIDSRTSQRENWIVISVFIAFLSGLDAWVSSHFWDFEPAVRPPPDGSLGLSLSLPVGPP